MRPSQQYENAPATDRWLNRRQAAEHVGLSSRTLDRLALDGSGPPFAVVGKRVLYPLRELDTWMRLRLATSTSAATVRATQAAQERG